MANVSKGRDRPGYRVKWRTPDGKHCGESGFRTRREALDRKREIESALRKGTYIDPREGGLQFRKVAAAWLDGKSDIKARTRAGYEALLKPAGDIDTTFGGYPVNAITRQLVQDWVSSRSKDRRPSTVRNAFFVVRQVLAQAVIDGRITANPCEHVSLPKTKSKAHGSVENTATFLSGEQVERLAREMPWPYDVLVLLASWTGLRAGELAGLQVGDVDLRRNTLHVRRTVLDLNGLAYDTPKTSGSTRTVPLTPSIVDNLADYLATHPRRDEPEAPLFPGTKRGNTFRLDWDKVLRHSAMYGRHFRPAVARAKLPRSLRFHDLRHTYASLCVARGLHPKEISEFMGHANINTTMGIYAHLFEEDRSEAMAKLDSGRPQRSTASNVVPLRRPI
jgi:integrase